MLRVALLAMGGPNWIAGAQYLRSLIYGNSLLPVEEQSSFRLYLDFGDHWVSDYPEGRALTAGVHSTEFEPRSSHQLYHKLRTITRIVVRQRRWPPLVVRDLRQLLRKHKTDVLFAGNDILPHAPIPQISWIPDFQHLHLPGFFSEKERRARDQRFARVMAEAAYVIVSNQYSYADAAGLYPQFRHKLAVTPFTMYLGSSWRNGDTQRVVSKYNLPAKFLLFPSQFWKHKNHLTAFRAIQLLRERGMEDAVLVCTGFPGDPRFPEYANELRDFLDSRQLGNAVRILGLLPRDDQVQLMRAAAAIVQPSLFEGWSALLEECRSLDKLVFASDIPMHREQVTESVHLFAPASAEALADLLGKYWREVRPGPDLEAEAVAVEQYQMRIREFARQFITVCHRAAIIPALAS